MFIFLWILLCYPQPGVFPVDKPVYNVDNFPQTGDLRISQGYIPSICYELYIVNFFRFSTVFFSKNENNLSENCTFYRKRRTDTVRPPVLHSI
jgi:hypothetical protein